MANKLPLMELGEPETVYKPPLKWHLQCSVRNKDGSLGMIEVKTSLSPNYLNLSNEPITPINFEYERFLYYLEQQLMT